MVSGNRGPLRPKRTHPDTAAGAPVSDPARFQRPQCAGSETGAPAPFHESRRRYQDVPAANPPRILHFTNSPSRQSLVLMSLQAEPTGNSFAAEEVLPDLDEAVCQT